jgi:hypothetical protein
MALPARSESIPPDLPLEVAAGLNVPTARARGGSNRAGSELIDPSDTRVVRYSAEFSALLRAERRIGRVNLVSFQALLRPAPRGFGSASDYLQLVAVCAVTLIAVFGTAYLPLGQPKPVAEVEYREPTSASTRPGEMTLAADMSSRHLGLLPLISGVWFTSAPGQDPVLGLLPITTQQTFTALASSVPTITAAAVPTSLPLPEPRRNPAPSTLPPFGARAGPSVVASDTRQPVPPERESRSSQLRANAGITAPAREDEQEAVAAKSTAGEDSADRHSGAIRSAASKVRDVTTASGIARDIAAAVSARVGGIDANDVRGGSERSGPGSDGAKDKDKENGKDRDKGKDGRDQGRGDKEKGDKGKDGKR